MIYLKMSCPGCGGHVQFPEEAIGLTVDCPHCNAPFLLEDPKSIYGWMQKQKWPLDRAGVTKTAEAKLNELRLVGMKHVGVLGSNSSDDCEASQSIAGQNFTLETVPPLPLPACDRKFCKCIYIAME